MKYYNYFFLFFLFTLPNYLFAHNPAGALFLGITELVLVLIGTFFGLGLIKKKLIQKGKHFNSLKTFALGTILFVTLVVFFLLIYYLLYFTVFNG